MCGNEIEIGKYYKRKSQKSKSSRKSNHKHENKECLLKSKFGINRAEYCPICYKIHDAFFFETIKLADGKEQPLDAGGILEKYKDLEIFEVNSVFNRNIEDTVPISRDKALCDIK